MPKESVRTDLSPLDSLLQKYHGRGREALLPLLHDAQELSGWLPEVTQEKVGETLRVPLAEVHGVVEFYSMLYNEPTSRRVIRLCEDPACYLAGSEEVGSAIGSYLAGTDDSNTTFEYVPCLGMCDHAPAGLNGNYVGGNLRPDQVKAFLREETGEPEVKAFGKPNRILRRVGKVDPFSLQDYEDHAGYQALKIAIEMGPENVINHVERSGLLGRGGAMFPLGRKWRFTRAADGQPESKHIVVNADESEPGTFKDRCLMEGDPFAIIEGATIAAFAVGAENGWIFVRGEYPTCLERLANAVEEARKAGLLGRNILGVEGFDFDIQIRRGAGAYICGEETALFEAIEGKRGFPRIKPPFPVTHGLFQQPTAVNNVETLASAVTIFELGIEQWLSTGTGQSTGTKLFCLSGHVARPGVYEVPFGLSVAELIEMAGGVPENRSIQGILIGGAAGTFIGPESLDFQLDYEEARNRNIPLGSGVIMVFDETADIRKAIWQLSRFFAHESCGKCFPCQLGTERQKEILQRIAETKRADPHDKQAIQDIGFTMSETSLCGLGQTAASAVLSAINLWPELFE